MPTRDELGALRALVQLYTPAAQQPLFTLLCEIEAAVGESLRPGIEHQVAHARLAWWREECARYERGEPAHPLTRSLVAQFSAAGRAPAAGLSGFVDAATWDLASATCETRRELDAYCTRWAVAMLTPLAQLAAVTAANEALGASTSAVVQLGATLREIELLANLAQDARRGRLRVPLDELARARTEPGQLARPPWTAALAALLSERHQLLRRQLAAQVSALPSSAQPPLRGVLVWASLAQRLSQRCERALPQAPGPREHHRPLDGARAWQAARRADECRLRLPGEE
jgi:15-cis-phytoene synthase